jgi:Leucine-rich repeat (LRR) protein
MIIKIQNLDHLVHLKILNVEFNQITRLEGLEKLHELEELFASYNSIDTIADELTLNQQLKMVHLAYNDLKSVNDIQILSSLPQLAVLSVFGNPFLSSLNYITFIKMMIPSLILLDDKDANEYVISANVYPHEDIIILKEALNKLIDERNQLHKETIKIE